MSEYSTSEMIVGYDGSTPIYRKIFKGTLASPYAISHGITGLNAVYRLDGYCKSSSSTRPLNLAYYGDASWDSALSINATYLIIEAGSNYLNAHTGYDYVITVEYTKS